MKVRAWWLLTPLLVGQACDSSTGPGGLANGTFELATTGEHYGASLSGEAWFASGPQPGGDSIFQIALVARPRDGSPPTAGSTMFIFQCYPRPEAGSYPLVAGWSGLHPVPGQVRSDWLIGFGSQSSVGLTPLHGTIRITESGSARVLGDIDAEYVQDYWWAPMELSVVRGRFNAEPKP